MSAAPASLAWFARHEIGLQWREFVAMMTAGRRRRGLTLLIVLGVVALLLHLMADAVVTPWLAAGLRPDKANLLLLTGGGLLFWSVMLSQAMESVTRAYYARADLDLILSSPASSRRLFAVRTSAIALASIVLACLLASPLIDVLVLRDGPQWLAAYGVLAALGALSAALAVLITLALFRFAGPRRTRLLSQILAAIVGAGFIIGIQAAAILAYGSLSRFSVLQSAEAVAMAPDVTSLVWLPARAAMGDLAALLPVLVLGFGALALVVVGTASSFGTYVLAAASVGQQRGQRQPAPSQFRSRSPREALRAKEWALLRRDPWLLSQTLMQILYLVPPALLLWLNYGKDAGVFVVIVPVLVMAAGQLAGGLAWLAISGEDAYDLVTTAPVPPGTVLRAKMEAVMAVVGLIMAPLLLLIAISSPQTALIGAAGVALAAASATAIQLWFRVQARRSLFGRRQVSSRAATISEAFASIMWAATAGTLTAAPVLAILPGACALLVLAIACAVSPRQRLGR